MPVISRGVPAFSSNNAYGGNPASQANDGVYDRGYRSTGYPMWIAYDLSSVPVTLRGRVFVAWYNDSFGYDSSTQSTTPASYNEPGDYRIEGHAASGGTVPGASDAGWVTLAQVTGNTFHSRSHVVEFTGYNWLRFKATAGALNNQNQNMDCDIKLDVHDAHLDVDAWVFIGDSITALSMGHAEDGDQNFAEQVSLGAAGRFPAYEGAGFPYLSAVNDGVNLVQQVLAVSPAHFVGLAFGSNDGAGNMATDMAFHDAYKAMADMVLASGRVPVIPSIPFSNDATHNANIGDPADLAHPLLLNVQLTLLKQEYAAAGKPVLDGPDLWTYFQAHPSLIEAGGVHPVSNGGTAAYRSQWAAAALAHVYP